MIAIPINISMILNPLEKEVQKVRMTIMIPQRMKTNTNLRRVTRAIKEKFRTLTTLSLKLC